MEYNDYCNDGQTYLTVCHSVKYSLVTFRSLQSQYMQARFAVFDLVMPGDIIICVGKNSRTRLGPTVTED